MKGIPNFVKYKLEIHSKSYSLAPFQRLLRVAPSMKIETDISAETVPSVIEGRPMDIKRKQTLEDWQKEWEQVKSAIRKERLIIDRAMLWLRYSKLSGFLGINKFVYDFFSKFSSPRQTLCVSPFGYASKYYSPNEYDAMPERPPNQGLSFVTIERGISSLEHFLIEAHAVVELSHSILNVKLLGANRQFFPGIISDCILYDPNRRKHVLVEVERGDIPKKFDLYKRRLRSRRHSLVVYAPISRKNLYTKKLVLPETTFHFYTLYPSKQVVTVTTFGPSKQA